MRSATVLAILNLIVQAQVLFACVPNSLDPSSIKITLSSHDSSYQPGDIHFRNCSQASHDGRRYIGWCPDPHDQTPYVEIDLHNLKAVHALQFQTTYSDCSDVTHKYDTEAFLASFDLEYVMAGDEEQNWLIYYEDLPALDGTGPERKYNFPEPLVTSSLRIIPKMQNIYSCFRISILACEATELCPDSWCLHGGRCSGENRCTCSQGYYGDRCNISASTIEPENYDFLKIKDDQLETPDATFDVIGNVTLETYRKRDSHHHHHHGHSVHCSGHHSYFQYKTGHYHHHHGRRRDSHHHSHCMSNLGHSSHGFTTSMNIHYGHHHDHHKPSCIFSNGGNVHGIQGASLHYHNGQLHFQVQTPSHHWTVSAHCNLHNSQWHHVQCSWHPHTGVSVHVNNQHIGSSWHGKPNSHTYTQTVPLRFCHNHQVNVHVDVQISALVMYPVSQHQLTNAGITGPLTPPPPTTPTTTTLSTTVPSKPSATTTIAKTTTTTPVPTTTTSGPFRPMCYTCMGQSSLGTCQTKIRCQVGEVCALFQDKTGYNYKCLEKQLCIAGKQLAGSSCWECCESYLCNDHCSASVNVKCEDKSSCRTLMLTGYDVCKDPKISVDLCRKSCNKC